MTTDEATVRAGIVAQNHSSPNCKCVFCIRRSHALAALARLVTRLREAEQQAQAGGSAAARSEDEETVREALRHAAIYAEGCDSWPDSRWAEAQHAENKRTIYEAPDALTRLTRGTAEQSPPKDDLDLGEQLMGGTVDEIAASSNWPAGWVRAYNKLDAEVQRLKAWEPERELRERLAAAEAALEHTRTALREIAAAELWKEHDYYRTKVRDEQLVGAMRERARAALAFTAGDGAEPSPPKDTARRGSE